MTTTHDGELDQIILDLVHAGSMIPRGKTINADMFPEAKAKLEARELAAREDEVWHFSDNIQDWSKLDTDACWQLGNARDIRLATLKSQQQKGQR